MFLTPQQREVQNALDRFWFTYYTKSLTAEQRIELADQFAVEWLDRPKFKIDSEFIRHPATLKRSFSRSHTVADVLADFIMRVDQVAERSAEYPISNPDHQVKGDRDRRENERSVYNQYQEDEAEKDEQARIPPYSVRESDIVLENSAEDILFKEASPSVKQFRAQLRKVKEFAEFYATTFADEYGYDKQGALRLIKRLGLSRVRECEICGGAYYAHDLRQRYCDCQQNPIENLSTCQRIAKQIGDLVREKSII
ncbi:hypothetical protein [Bacillus sp. FJAT-52991]|uniref:Uncharacterized protein n=1 Tax=Bacillus kandeliae TaxID=3129297 RepID=A0ABZ2N852_9BACI